MANITEVSQWENVIRQIENGEAATGGADGLANVQAKQLANRTQYLKGNLAPIVNAAFSGTLKHGGNDLAGSAIVAKLLAQNGYIKYANGLLIQWGRLILISGTASAGTTAEITFPLSFYNEYSYAFMAMPAINSGAINITTVDKMGNNKITIKTLGTTNQQAHWFAIGQG